MSLSKPIYPLIHLGEGEAHIHPIPQGGVSKHQNEVAGPPGEGIGSRFQILPSLGFSNLSVKVFHDIWGLTEIVDGYCHGTLSNADFSALMAKRNALQHRLMSIPPATEIDTGHFLCHAVYEPCRLATILYSIAVTLPVPMATGLHRNLVRLLKMAISEMDVQQCYTEVPHILLWTCTMGGVAASQTKERGFFVQVLARLLVTSRIHRWLKFKRIVKSFLWLESACDPGAHDLWDDISRTF